MPLYDFKCENCGNVQEKFAKIDEITSPCDCGTEMKRLITSRYYVNPDIEYVTDNISGDPIRVSSRKQLRGLLRQHGLVERYGKGWH